MQYLHKNSITDIPALVDLINRAYRGDDGNGRWTSEHHLVAGDRISANDLARSLQQDNVEFVVGCRNQTPICCIALTHFSDYVELGTFAVDPMLQGGGEGKAILDYAEQLARRYAPVCEVSVVSPNTHLIAFYQRRGYEDTGLRKAYPLDMNVGTPMVENLDLTILRKKLNRV